MLLCRTGLLSTSDGVGSSVASSPIKDLCDCSEKSILCRYAELRVEETQNEGIGFIYQSWRGLSFPAGDYEHPIRFIYRVSDATVH